MTRGWRFFISAVVVLGCVALGAVGGCYCFIPLAGLGPHPPTVFDRVAVAVLYLGPVAGLVIGSVVVQQMWK